MSLEINRVALELVGASPEEMVEADFKQRRGGSVRGNVAANAVVDAVGANHHGQRVPPNQALDAALDFLIAREDGLFFKGNRIQVRSVRGEGKRDAEGLSVAAKPVQQSDRGFLAFFAYDLVEGFYPLLYFLGIHAEYVRVGVSIHNFLPSRSLGGSQLHFTPDLPRGRKKSVRHSVFG